MSDFYTIESFSPLVGTQFLMHYGDSRTGPLELMSVTDVGSSRRQMQFSLVFLGPVDAPVAQAIYRLEHDSLGAIDMFLVPIARDQNGVQYEAIFSRVFE